MTARLALVLALTSCAHLPRATPPIAGADTPPVVTPLAPAIVLGGAGDEAGYGERTVARAPDAIADAAEAAVVARTWSAASFVRDPRVSAAAAEIADAIARGGPVVDDEAVRFALDRHGVIEPAVMVDVTGPVDSAGALVDAIAGKLAGVRGAAHRLGIAGHARRVAIVTGAELMTLVRPLPRALPFGGAAVLDAVLDARLHAPHLNVTHEDDRVDHPPVIAIGDHHFAVTIACGAHVGVQWVAIEACDPSNAPVGLGALPIVCYGEPTPVYRIEPVANTSASDPARALAAIINRERAAGALPPLRGDIRLDRVARDHAARMARAQRVSHDLGGSARDRLRRAGLDPPRVGETVLAAGDLGAVAERLMNAPGFQSSIEGGGTLRAGRPDYTHVGVGAARGRDGQLYVAVELAGIPPRTDPALVTAAVLAKLSVVSQIPLAVEPRLSAVAARLAEAQAAGATGEQLADYITTNTGFAYSRVSQASARIVTLDEIDAAKLITANPFHRIGIGIYQDPPGGRTPGWIWISILYAKLDDQPPKPSHAGGPDI